MMKTFKDFLSNAIFDVIETISETIKAFFYPLFNFEWILNWIKRHRIKSLSKQNYTFWLFMRSFIDNFNHLMENSMKIFY